MQNIVLDLGNFDVKTSNKIAFTSRYVEVPKEDKDNYTGETVLEYNDKVYFMEKGSYESKDNKVERDYKPLLLAGIAKAIAPVTTAHINLCLLLPIRNINRKEDLINELEGKTFEYKYDKKNYKITIDKTGVLEEGMVSYYALPKDKRKGRVLMLDFGGKTINGIAFNNGKVVEKLTYDKGILQINEAILKELYKNYTGQSIREEDIEEYIDRDIHGLKSIAAKQYLAYAKKANKWLDKFGDLSLYDAYLTGGAIQRLEPAIGEELKTKLPNYTVMEESRFTNATGAKNIIDIKWKVK